MKQSRILWIGLAVYSVSFFLVSSQGPGSGASPVRGYLCAWESLALPWAGFDLWSRGVGPVLMPATLLAGWINPIFIAAIAALLAQRGRLFTALRIVVLLMLPACWIVFFFGFWPREGYFIWTVGMLVALFSKGLADLMAGEEVQALELRTAGKP